MNTDVGRKDDHMRYQNEWLLLEADDIADEMEHRHPTEEFLFYEAVMSGDVEAVRKTASRSVLWTVRVSACCRRIRLQT